MKPLKTSFDVLDFNFEVIMNLSSGPYDFCEMWQGYLAGCGWTEEEFELEMEKRIFSSAQED